MKEVWGRIFDKKDTKRRSIDASYMEIEAIKYAP
jgi:hypothetical protein